MRRIAGFAALAGCALLAMQPPQPPSAPAVEAKPVEAPAGPPVFTYEGKPLKLPVPCKDDEISAFGLTCTIEEPCPVYLEIAAVEPVGSKIFLTGNLHTTSNTLYSVLLRSDDNGKTWTEAFERLRSSGLEQIQFLDFEAGWVGGQMFESLPRDPFFLATTDGGKTFRRIPVFSESRVGAIEQFLFDSRTQGSLLIDRTQSGESGARHELYETMTSGDTWMVREVSSRPLKLKRLRTPNADWRVRADRATNSFKVEKRQGAGFQTVAAFLIPAGECKPVERVLQEPPTATEAAAAESDAVEVLVVPSRPGTRVPPKKKPVKKPL
jgi:hypothetical protein